MATVMSNPPIEKVRLPSISSLTVLHHDILPSLASVTSSSPPLPLPPTQDPTKDPLSTLRAAADIFAKELPLSQTPAQGHPQAQQQTYSQPPTHPKQPPAPQPQIRTTPPSTGNTQTPDTGPLVQTTPPPSFSPRVIHTPTMTHNATFQPPPTYHQGPAAFHQPPSTSYFFNSYTAVPQDNFETTPNSVSHAQVMQQMQRNSFGRTRILPQRACQRCGITDTPEWRKGPNGARTLCNACGLFYAKILKRDGPEAAAYAIMNSTVTKRKHSLQRRSPMPMPMEMPLHNGVPMMHPNPAQFNLLPHYPYQLPPGQIHPGQPGQFIPGPPPYSQGHAVGYPPMPPPNMYREG